jgi:predicted DsbA family dithiol-disulfide isomerase
LSIAILRIFTHSSVSSFTGPVSLTTPAHRLMSKAYEIGGPAAQSSLITPIFRAYYEDDLDISDSDVLADAAEQAAIMSKAEVSAPHAVLHLWRRRISNLKSDGC